MAAGHSTAGKNTQIGTSSDCLATFDCDGDEVHMRAVYADSELMLGHYLYINTDTHNEGDYDIDIYFDHYSDSTESGWLISDYGQIFGHDIGYYDTTIDPEADALILEDYISMRVDLYDDDGNWEMELSFFLRPWGSDFNDFNYVSENDLPYMCVNWDPTSDDMFPFNYDSWYVDIMDDPFPGLDAIVGRTRDN